MINRSAMNSRMLAKKIVSEWDNQDGISVLETLIAEALDAVSVPACAVADAWVDSRKLHKADRRGAAVLLHPYDMTQPVGLILALDAIEAATRESPFRKVKP